VIRRLISGTVAALVFLCALVAGGRTASAASCTVPIGPCPTIQAALNQAVAGDTISVNTGTYSEKITFPSGGTPGNPITLRATPGHHPVLDGTGVSGSNMILIDGTASPKSYIVVRGFEIRNNLNVSDGSGVRILGAGTAIEIRDNEIHNITGDHAMGITVYASEASAIAALVIDGNTIHDCEPAQSEALTLNGNVDGFQITNNVVRDVNSIGIDCIGGETDIQPNPALVCRNGLIKGNTVIRANADYEGGFAGGIYVDGGRDIVIENNTITGCDLGIEIGAENAGTVTDNVKVRNNIIYENEKAGLVFGGFSSSVGRANDNEFRGNTLYRNNTLGESGQGRFFSGNGVSEVWIQFGDGNVFENNIVYAGSENVFVGSFDAGSSVNNTFDHNLFFSDAGIAAGEFSLNGTGYTGLSAWQAGTGQDANSLAGNPLFTNPAAGNFHIAVASPAVNGGNAGFVPDVSEVDLDGQPRKIGASVDIGADEGTCGNGGAADPGEACDDGNAVNCDGCDNDCSLSGTCGNGVTCSGFGEACDDGNTANGDCCSSTCTHESAGTGCSDQNACTEGDVCDGAGVCAGDTVGGPACALDTDLRKCQEAIAKSGRRYFETDLKAQQKCRNDLNNGRTLYFDQGQTMPLAAFSDCDQEYNASARATKAAIRWRDSIVSKCTDVLVAQLAACAATVDGLVGPGAASGCLLSTHAAAVDVMIDDQYGNQLTGMEASFSELRRCQENIAKAGRSYSVARVKQLQSCRNRLNRGKLLYFDDAGSMPLINPNDCDGEASSAGRIAKAATRARGLLEDRCTDILLAQLPGACAATVDALINPAADGGCLVDGHALQTGAIIDALY
jgi:cysteine-rich repeat protein/parallel beta-helix repeat protein